MVPQCLLSLAKQPAEGMARKLELRLTACCKEARASDVSSSYNVLWKFDTNQTRDSAFNSRKSQIQVGLMQGVAKLGETVK